MTEVHDFLNRQGLYLDIGKKSGKYAIDMAGVPPFQVKVRVSVDKNTPHLNGTPWTNICVL